MLNRTFTLTFGNDYSGNTVALESGMSTIRNFMASNREVPVKIELIATGTPNLIPLSMNYVGAFPAYQPGYGTDYQRYKSVELTASGSTIMLYRETGKTSGSLFNFYNFDQVTIKDITVKVASGNVANFQGEVVSKNSVTISGQSFTELEIELDTNVNNCSSGLVSSANAYYTYDGSTSSITPDSLARFFEANPEWTAPITVNASGNYVVPVLATLTSSTLIGDDVFVKMDSRNYYGFTFVGCDNISVQDVDLYDMPGACFTALGCGNVYIKDVVVDTEEPERLFSCGVDVFKHIEPESVRNGSFDFTVDNLNVNQYAGDDILNIHIEWMKVTERLDGKVRLKKLGRQGALETPGGQMWHKRSSKIYSFDESGYISHDFNYSNNSSSGDDYVEIEVNDSSKIRDYVIFKLEGTTNIIVKNSNLKTIGKGVLENVAGYSNVLIDSCTAECGGPLYWCGSYQTFFPETAIKQGKTVIKRNVINKTNGSLNNNQGVIDTWVDFDNGQKIQWTVNDKEIVIESNTFSGCYGYIADLWKIPKTKVYNNTVIDQEYPYIKVSSDTNLINDLITDTQVIMSDLPNNFLNDGSEFPTQRLIPSAYLVRPTASISSQVSSLDPVTTIPVIPDVYKGNKSSPGTNIEDTLIDCALEIIGWFQISGTLNTTTNNYLPETDQFGQPIRGDGWVAYEKPGAMPGDIVVIYRLNTISRLGNSNALWQLVNPGGLTYWTSSYDMKMHVSPSDIRSLFPHPGEPLAPINTDNPNRNLDVLWRNVVSQYDLPGPGNSNNPFFIRQSLPDFGIRMIVWTDSCCHVINNSISPPKPPVTPPPIAPPVGPPVSPPSPPPVIGPPSNPPGIGGGGGPGGGGGAGGGGGSPGYGGPQGGSTVNRRTPIAVTGELGGDKAISGQPSVIVGGQIISQPILPGEYTSLIRTEPLLPRSPLGYRNSTDYSSYNQEVVTAPYTKPGVPPVKRIDAGSLTPVSENQVANDKRLSETDYFLTVNARIPSVSFDLMKEGGIESKRLTREVRWNPVVSEVQMNDLGLSNFNVAQGIAASNLGSNIPVPGVGLVSSVSSDRHAPNKSISDPITPPIIQKSAIPEFLDGSRVVKVTTPNRDNPHSDSVVSQKNRSRIVEKKPLKPTENSSVVSKNNGIQGSSLLTSPTIPTKQNNAKIGNTNAAILSIKAKRPLGLIKTNESIDLSSYEDANGNFEIRPIIYNSIDGSNMITVVCGKADTRKDMVLTQTAYINSSEGTYIANLGNSGPIRFGGSNSNVYMVGSPSCLPGPGNLPDVIAGGRTWSFISIVSHLATLQGAPVAQSVTNFYPISPSDTHTIAPNKLPVGVMRDLEIVDSSRFIYDGCFDKRGASQLEWYYSEPHFIFERVGSADKSVTLVLKATVTSQQQSNQFKPVMEIYANDTLISSGSLVSFVTKTPLGKPGWVNPDGSYMPVGSLNNSPLGSTGIRGAGGSNAFVITAFGQITDGPYNPSIYGTTHHSFMYFPVADASYIAASTKYRLRVHNNGPANEFNGYSVFGSNIRIPAVTTTGLTRTNGLLYGSIKTFHCNQIFKIVNVTTGQEVERKTNWQDGTIVFDTNTPAASLLSISSGNTIRLYRPGFDNNFNSRSLVYEFTAP